MATSCKLQHCNYAMGRQENAKKNIKMNYVVNAGHCQLTKSACNFNG